MASARSSLEIFKKLSEELADLLEKEGIVVRPYANPQMIYFKALPEKHQLETISGLKHFIETARRVLRLGRSLKDSEFFVKTALEYFGFEPHPEFATRAYDPTVVVEFYSLNGIQLFRTFNYFEFTSYTLEDIYSRRWNDLYERPQATVTQMFTEVETLLQAADPKKTLIYGPHTIKERVSLEKIETFCDGMHISPMCRAGQVVALSSLVACRPVL